MFDKKGVVIEWDSCYQGICGLCGESDDNDDDNDDDLDGLGDMNKHVHRECVVFEDIIIMMECDKIVWLKVTRVRWMMMMWGVMIDTNRDDRVVFPISMCVRELELR